MCAFKSALKRTNTEDPPVSPPPLKRKLHSTITNANVSSFFLPTSQKPPEATTWRTVNDSLLVARYNPPETLGSKEVTPKRRKIAGFDFDSTLITSASGNKFSKDATDWKWWHVSVPSALKQLDQDGYQVIIFSNQGGISLKSDPKGPSSDQKRLADFKRKINSVLAHLQIPISVYAATTRDQYRKPRLGMWKKMKDDYSYDLDTSSTLDLDGSVFVGDAGGRPGSEGRKAGSDFASSDRDFAANIRIPFKTPEEFFLSESPKDFARAFDPVQILAQSASDSPPFLRKHPLEVVVFCGSPGAGKSTFYWTNLAGLGYERVNQDILKTRDRCLKVARDHLKAQQSVVVDATNADPETRGYWIRLGQEFRAPVRCVLFKADGRLCEHNDAVRAFNSSLMNPEGRSLLPRIAFTGFNSRFRAPALAEGFEDITQVEFVFSGTPEQKAVWSQFWI